MAWTTTDLDSLKTALASGVLEAAIEGRTIRYNSASDLIKAISTVEADLIGRGVITQVVRRKTLISSSSNFSGSDSW